MAKKKTSSQAEKIVTDTKRKAPPSKSNSKKKPPKKAANSKKQPKVATEYENPVSSSLVTALISFCLFVLFAVCAVKWLKMARQGLSAVIFGVLAVVYGVHLYCGLYFFLCLVGGAGYWMT